MNTRTSEDLVMKQSLPLSVKILLTKSRIRDWYNEFCGDVYISFSGGKDSTVLLDLVRSMYPDVIAVYVDTGKNNHNTFENTELQNLKNSETLDGMATNMAEVKYQKSGSF